MTGGLGGMAHLPQLFSYKIKRDRSPFAARGETR